MPVHMPNCKTSGEVFPGIFVMEQSSYDLKSAAAGAQIAHVFEGRKKEYVTLDYRDGS